MSKVEIEAVRNGFVIRQEGQPSRVRGNDEGEGEIVTWEYNDKAGDDWYVRFGRVPR